MKLNKIEFLENLNDFIDYSDEYININLQRKIWKLSSIWYYDSLRNFYLSIGEDGKLNDVKIYHITEILKSYEIIYPKNIIKGDAFFESIEYDEDKIQNIELEFLEIIVTENTITCYFEKNIKDIYYGVKISKKIMLLIDKDNIMKGVLINGEFKIENGEFYSTK